MLKLIEEFENCTTFEGKPEGYGKVYRGYEDSKDKGLDFIVLNDCIWDREVPGIIETLRSLGVTEVVLASGFSGLLEIMKQFQDLGCKFGDIIDIKWYKPSFSTIERSLYIPGIMMTLNS